MRYGSMSKMTYPIKCWQNINFLKILKLNLQKCKGLLCASNRPPSLDDNYFFDNIDKGLDAYSAYERVAQAGDFNT